MKVIIREKLLDAPERPIILVDGSGVEHALTYGEARDLSMSLDNYLKLIDRSGYHNALWLKNRGEHTHA